MKNRYSKGSHVSEARFREVIRFFAADLPALTASELSGLNYRTVHRIYTLMRERLVEMAFQEIQPFAGDIEVDESYSGARRVRGKRGRGAGGKIPVLGLHKRGDRVFVSVVKNCSRQELMPILKGHVLSSSDIYTDGWKAYDGLVTNGYQHHRVHHHENQFARGKNHVNGIESFWSYAKHRLLKLRSIRKEKFLLHLKECEWRWNHRHYKISQSFSNTSASTLSQLHKTQTKIWSRQKSPGSLMR
jgi:transposase-like protein